MLKRLPWCQKLSGKLRWSTQIHSRTGMRVNSAVDKEIEHLIALAMAKTPWTTAMATCQSAAKMPSLNSLDSSIARLSQRVASASLETWSSTACARSIRSRNILSATHRCSARSSKKDKPCALFSSLRSPEEIAELIIVQTEIVYIFLVFYSLNLESYIF